MTMLTGCEREVALLIAEGLSLKEMAAKLGNSKNTVDHHRTAIYRKTGINDRLQLALAIRDGRIKL